MTRAKPSRRPPVRIALTGGIASGKTAVSDAFAELGVAVLDADLIARELVAPGQPALAAIVDAFGREVLAADGSLDRQKMRTRIFRSPAARRRLEALLHPRILAQMDQRAGNASGPYVVLVIPLLEETGSRHLADRVLVVDCPIEAQLRRLLSRDGLDIRSAQRILAAQSSREARLALADDVIDNGGAEEALPGLVARLHHFYLQLKDRQDARSRPGLRLP